MSTSLLSSRFRFVACLFFSLIGMTSLHANDELKVVATIKPVHSILAGLMNGIETPTLILEGHSTPFDYQLSDEQKTQIAEADLLVWVGPELESFMINPVSTINRETSAVLTLLDNSELKILPNRYSADDDDTTRDPYFWLDSRNMLILVDELTRALMTVDTSRSHLYERNRTELKARIANIDRRLENGYRGLKKGLSINYFDTLQYFEQAYALKIRRNVMPSPVVNIAAGSLLKARIDLKSGQYRCLLTDKGMKMPELHLLLQDIDINIGALDVFGTMLKSGPELYFDLIKYNTQTIKDCLALEASDNLATRENNLASVDDSIGGKFILMDHNGALKTEKDLLDSYQLITFGYTSCPDVCPTTLQVVSQVMEKLKHNTDLIQPYFISIDPERDTVSIIKQYVNYFSADIIGLSGTPAMTKRIAKLFRVQIEKVPVADGDDIRYYSVDHTASIYLMSPEGDFITKFAYGISSQQLYERLQEYLPLD